MAPPNLRDEPQAAEPAGTRAALRPFAVEQAEPEPGPPRGFRLAFKVLAVVVLSAAAYGSYVVYDAPRPYEWSGAVEAWTVAVGSRVGGRVEKVLVREGQEVSPGDALVIIEPGDIFLQKAFAEAEVAEAEAVAAKLKAGARPEELAKAQAKLDAAKASASRAATTAEHDRRELARIQTLLDEGSAPVAHRDSLEAQALAAAGTRAQAEANAREEAAALQLLANGTRTEDLRIAGARLDAARAKLALANQKIDELTIRAPTHALVEAVTVRPGDLLRPDAHAVSLLEKGQLYVKIYIPEPRLGNIRVGQEVPVTVDSFPDRTFRGVVQHINNVGEFTPRRMTTTEERADEVFAARIALLDGEDALRAGMAAFIHVRQQP